MSCDGARRDHGRHPRPRALRPGRPPSGQPRPRGRRVRARGGRRRGVLVDSSDGADARRIADLADARRARPARRERRPPEAQLGVPLSPGEVVLFVDSDCVADTGLLVEHAAGHRATGAPTAGRSRRARTGGARRRAHARGAPPRPRASATASSSLPAIRRSTGAGAQHLLPPLGPARARRVPQRIGPIASAATTSRSSGCG